MISREKYPIFMDEKVEKYLVQFIVNENSDIIWFHCDVIMI